MKGYRLPPDLMLGAAGAAAPDRREYSRQDIDIAAAMGITTYRFSVDWAAIEPEEGRADRKELARCRDEVLYMKERGMAPLLVLHDFSDPPWFEKKGAFARSENIRYFLRFTGLVVRELGDLVSDYVSINEPNIYAMMEDPGSGEVRMAPDPVKWRRILSVMCACHIKAYRKIHRMREEMGYTDTKVGVALHMRAFAPEHSGAFYEKQAAMMDKWLLQGAPARAFLYGDFRFPIRNIGRFKTGIYCDFLGISYFTRSHVRIPGENRARPQDQKSDYGWEIYPSGLEECMRELYALCPRPIWITANGVCDEYDNFRCLFLYEQLQVLARTPLPVERYYHWSLLDDAGQAGRVKGRYGLVHVDFDTGVRKVKKSGLFYQEIIRSRGVTHDTAERYLKGEQYHL